MSPSPAFISLTRNPALAAQAVAGKRCIARTEKRPGDVIVTANGLVTVEEEVCQLSRHVARRRAKEVAA